MAAAAASDSDRCALIPFIAASAAQVGTGENVHCRCSRCFIVKRSAVTSAVQNGALSSLPAAAVLSYAPCVLWCVVLYRPEPISFPGRVSYETTKPAKV